MNIYDTWKPRTYYILENKTSGKKYIGQTIQDINKYLGSGKYWKNHCKQHGGYKRSNITIVSSKLYTSKETAQQYLDEFKFQNVNYWERDNKIWANSCEENTADSALAGGEISGRASRQRVNAGTHNLLGGENARQRVNAGTHNFQDSAFQRKNKEHIQNRLDAGTHNLLGGENARQRVKAGTHNFLGGEIQKASAKKLIAAGTHNCLTVHTCPHCGKVGKGASMFRWHFDNCKST
jgi:hypothetical protein